MESYSRAAMERMMKVQEVILQAMAKRITWYQAAEIIGISDRHMRRWRAFQRSTSPNHCDDTITEFPGESCVALRRVQNEQTVLSENECSELRESSTPIGRSITRQQ
jgi:hypothetical protein